MSTVKQDLSLDAQRKVIEDWAAKAGVEVVAWFEDPARSGSTPPRRRPGLLAALEALERLRAGVLVVAADDRLSRNIDHAGWVATEVKEARALVVDASKPEAEWIAMMFGRMHAQAYLESLRKNTIRGMAVKKARGERVGSVPYGFTLARDGVHLEPHPVEYNILLKILYYRQKGLGGRQIAAILAKDGHRPRGKAWNPGNLQTMANRWLAEGLPPKMKADLERGGFRKTSGAVSVTVSATEVALPPSWLAAAIAGMLDPAGSPTTNAETE